MVATTLSRGGYAMPMYIVGPDGEIVNFAGLLQALSANGNSSAMALDTAGNPVPVNRAHTFTYDPSGNLSTDTVSDGGNTWVRTYTYTGGNQTSDSGWVKQ